MRHRPKLKILASALFILNAGLTCQAARAALVLGTGNTAATTPIPVLASPLQGGFTMNLNRTQTLSISMEAANAAMTILPVTPQVFVAPGATAPQTVVAKKVSRISAGIQETLSAVGPIARSDAENAYAVATQLDSFLQGGPGTAMSAKADIAPTARNMGMFGAQSPRSSYKSAEQEPDDSWSLDSETSLADKAVQAYFDSHRKSMLAVKGVKSAQLLDDSAANLYILIVLNKSASKKKTIKNLMKKFPQLKRYPYQIAQP